MKIAALPLSAVLGRREAGAAFECRRIGEAVVVSDRRGDGFNLLGVEMSNSPSKA
jgi:hypothetical protein